MNNDTHNLNDNRTIIVKSNEKSIISGLEYVYPYYSGYTVFARVFRKAIDKFRINFLASLSYGRWKEILKETGLVILFDNGVNNVNLVSRYIKKINPNVKLVFWYWNPVTSGNNSAINDKNIDEVWTYNRFDAKKYNLKYSPQFYRQMLDDRVDNEAGLDIDMIFLGKDKGRKKILQGLEKNAVAMGLKCDFTIVRKKKDKVGYEEYSHRVLGSKCIVDLVPNQECGLTLRPMEALFYKKKLITNYKDIVNYDFYDKENIFLLGKDDVNKLVEFINSPYKEIDPRIVDFYRYESWLKRIENGEDIKI